MCKKMTLGVLGLVVVGGLLFGSRAIPYAKTAFKQVRAAAQDSVPVSLQIETAKDQLGAIGPQIHHMAYQIAKEKVQIKRLAADLNQHEQMLEKSYDEMMTLREHVQSGEKFYVTTNNKAFSTARVEEDLRHRFALYQTAEKTKEKKAEILAIRKTSLESAFAKLEEAKAQQRELEVQIENLVARNRMNEVVATASKINIDNSQLSKTRQLVDDIDAVISAQEEMSTIAPEYLRGQIPVNTDYVSPEQDILTELDAYFQDKNADSSEAVDSDEDLVLN